MLDLKVIFTILKITLNLHDPSLSGFSWNTRSNSLSPLGYRFGCNVVS
jgi:hypothetical protein